MCLILHLHYNCSSSQGGFDGEDLKKQCNNPHVTCSSNSVHQRVYTDCPCCRTGEQETVVDAERTKQAYRDAAEQLKVYKFRDYALILENEKGL